MRISSLFSIDQGGDIRKQAIENGPLESMSGEGVGKKMSEEFKTLGWNFVSICKYSVSEYSSHGFNSYRSHEHMR